MEISSCFPPNMLEQTISRIAGSLGCWLLPSSDSRDQTGANILSRAKTLLRAPLVEVPIRFEPCSRAPESWGVSSSSSSSAEAAWSIISAEVSANLLITQQTGRVLGAQASGCRPGMQINWGYKQPGWQVKPEVFLTLQSTHTMLNYDQDICTDPSLWTEKYGERGWEHWISIIPSMRSMNIHTQPRYTAWDRIKLG